MFVGGGDGSGRKSLNAEVNLVPFIDLLSMCICFLLMTAVWIQIGSLQIKQSKGTSAPTESGLDLSLRFLGPSSVELSLAKGSKTVKKEAIAETSPEKLVDKLDQLLPTAVTAALKSKTPLAPNQLGSVVSSAMVTPRPGVPYGTLVAAMDVLRRHAIVNLGVVPVGGE